MADLDLLAYGRHAVSIGEQFANSSNRDASARAAQHLVFRARIP
jgi:hypothetical protein